MDPALKVILVVVLLLFLLGSLPAWPHAQSWGWGPSGTLGVVLVIVLILFIIKAI